MSLLLDALKEAQKQRKSDDGDVPGRAELPDDNSENELEFELELDLESTAEPDGDGVNTLDDSTAGESKLIAGASLATSQADSVDKITPEPALQVSTPAQQEQVPPPVFTKANIESPHSANAVFRNRARQKTKRYLLLGLILACLLLLAIGAYLFFITESFAPPSQAPLQTKNINHPVEPLTPLPLVDPASAPSSLTSKAVIDTVTTAVISRDMAAEKSEFVEGEDNLATVTSQDAVTLAIKSNLEAESPHKSQVDSYVEIKSVEKAAEVLSAEESFAGIKIRKRHIPAKREISLRRARQAMASGDLAGAESNYGSVLKASPTHVVALLGMANLSAIKGQLDQAQLYYQRVLAQSPQNLNARAGLLSLASPSSLDVGSALQQLLREGPEKAFLHASLGDYYLKRSEWPAAQGAYFDAFSRDPKNANYAYNLAISLDQMAKPALALKFYQQALSLNKASPAHFDSSVLTARIAVLKAAAL